MRCRCVDVQAWSVVLRGSDPQAQQVTQQAQLACEALLSAPIRWRVDAVSSEVNSPALNSLTANLYCAGGVVTPFAFPVPFAEVGAHGVTVYVDYVAMQPEERLFISITPLSWPWWLSPRTADGRCVCR